MVHSGEILRCSGPVMNSIPAPAASVVIVCPVDYFPARFEDNNRMSGDSDMSTRLQCADILLYIGGRELLVNLGVPAALCNLFARPVGIAVTLACALVPGTLLVGLQDLADAFGQLCVRGVEPAVVADWSLKRSPHFRSLDFFRRSDIINIWNYRKEVVSIWFKI